MPCYLLIQLSTHYRNAPVSPHPSYLPRARCAVRRGPLLPGAMEVNLRALQAREPDSPALQRYDELGRLLTGREQAGAADAQLWIDALCSDLAIPRLATLGLTEGLLPVIVERALVANSTRTNPVKLSAEALAEIARRAM